MLRGSMSALTILIVTAALALTAQPAVAQDPSGYTDTAGNTHADAIAAISEAGIADGCRADAYCPDDAVRRDQMASFIAGALELDPADADRFTDVAEDNVHRGAIGAIAAAGITAGCGEARYCPDQLISRAQMATFLVTAFDVAATEQQYFHDVAGTHAANAQGIADAGISTGCDALGLGFCPDQSVRRDQMATFLARATELVPTGTIPMLLEPGDEGAAVEALQERLRSHDYWVGPIDGVYGTLTEHAVLAIQKVHGLTRDGIYGPSTRSAVADPGTPTTESSEGYVIEFDEDRQIVMLVQDGAPGLIFHASGGNEEYYTHEGTEYWAETPNGRWDIYREVDGWRTSHLGELYRPKYFHTDGIAFHGYTDVPEHAASHGCVRLSLDAMDWMWANGAMPIGADVLVYGEPT